MSTLRPVHQSLEVSAQILGVLKQRGEQYPDLALHIEAATWKVTAAMHKFSADEWQRRAENLDDELEERFSEYEALEERFKELEDRDERTESDDA